MLSDFRIRLGTPGDKEAVLDFCRNTFAWGDYWPQVWDEWIARPDGRMLIGEVEDRPIAVGYVRRVTPEEAWLQGLRVNPQYREHGVAQLFTERALAEARDLGAKVARLSTLADNYPIHRVMAKLGCQHVAGFVPHDARPLANESSYLVLGSEHRAEVTAYLDCSDVFQMMGRLFFPDWICHELSVSVVQTKLAQGDILAERRNAQLAAIALISRHSTEQNVLGVDYADGDSECLVLLAKSILSFAASRGFDSIEAHIPDHSTVRSAFQTAGFSSAGHDAFWIFQKDFR